MSEPTPLSLRKRKAGTPLSAGPNAAAKMTCRFDTTAKPPQQVRDDSPDARSALCRVPAVAELQICDAFHRFDFTARVRGGSLVRTRCNETALDGHLRAAHCARSLVEDILRGQRQDRGLIQKGKGVGSRAASRWEFRE